MAATFEELALEASMRNWSLTGKNRVVKVVSPTGEAAIQRYGNTAMGYITQEKFLYGCVAHEIERLLGLRPHELRQMAQVYALERLPTIDEVEFKLTVAFPDGKVFDDAHYAQAMQARQDFGAGKELYTRSITPVMQYYQPGSGMIFQWKLIKPVPIASKIATVTNTLAFPRENGSIKRYTPHNRGPIR